MIQSSLACLPAQWSLCVRRYANSRPVKAWNWECRCALLGWSLRQETESQSVFLWNVQVRKLGNQTLIWCWFWVEMSLTVQEERWMNLCWADIKETKGPMRKLFKGSRQAAIRIWGSCEAICARKNNSGMCCACWQMVGGRDEKASDLWPFRSQVQIGTMSRVFAVFLRVSHPVWHTLTGRPEASSWSWFMWTPVEETSSPNIKWDSSYSYHTLSHTLSEYSAWILSIHILTYT